MFGTALVGLYTIEDLWNKFGDLKMPKVFHTISHVLTRLMKYTDRACLACRIQGCGFNRDSIARIHVLILDSFPRLGK